MEDRPLPPVFETPEAELSWLRERVAQQEAALSRVPAPPPAPPKKEAIVAQEIRAYTAAAPTPAHLAPKMRIESPEFDSIVDRLTSVPHQEKMRELYRVLSEKGVWAVVKLAREMNNPNLEDDVHRVLVQYVKTGSLVPGLDREHDLSHALKMTLLEITLPHASGDDGKVPPFKDVIVAMERFLRGVLPFGSDQSAHRAPFAFEVALPNFSSETTFYLSVSDRDRDLFMKQLLATFPNAKVEDLPEDYNVFNEFGVTMGAVAQPSAQFSFPLAFADDADHDPLQMILNAFSQIARDGEGLAFQMVLWPETGGIADKIRSAIGDIKKGESVSRAVDIPVTTTAETFRAVGGFFRELTKDDSKKDEPKKSDPHKEEKERHAIEMLEEKVKFPLVRANLRLVASAPSRERAGELLGHLEASFNQFARVEGNGIAWKRLKDAELEKMLYRFTFREPDSDALFVLNTKEIATMFHLPASIAQREAPHLKTVKAATAPAPSEVPTEGVSLGTNRYRGQDKTIRLAPADRLRHLYVIGQTGTGKTNILKHMVVEDIKAGHGVCFIDPHGSDVQDILANIPPERIDDVIYFDPSDARRPFGLNMLEYDFTKPDQKIFVVNELFSIFRKLYSSTPEAMGPAFEQYFRNSTMLVMEDPASGMTLLEISRVLADKKFRDLKLSRCKNPIVTQFWREIAEKTSGETGLQNMIPYITNKFDVFLANDVMRPIIGQETSSFNARDIMDNKKILLVNLAKGKLGEINSHLLGLILVGKIFMAAMSRVDVLDAAGAARQKLPDFYLYIDEFQNVSTDSISGILSEARKYGLSLNIAHQFIGQLEESIKNAVFGNVGNMAIFRVGTEDAQFLEPQFAPIFTASDITKLEMGNAYMRMLMNGKPVPPFNIKVPLAPRGNPDIVADLKELSSLKYGRDRAETDEAILAKYFAGKGQAAPAAPPPARPAAPLPTAFPSFAEDEDEDDFDDLELPSLGSLPVSPSPAASSVPTSLADLIRASTPPTDQGGA